MALNPTTIPPVAEASSAEQTVLSGKSYADYLAASEAHPRLRVEFLDGEILMTPAPRPIYQRILQNLNRVLDAFVYSNHLGELLFAPLDVELQLERHILQPDLIFITADRIDDLIGDTHITDAPDMAVEILSPSTAHSDRHRKLPVYAEAGVAEYWIVDPDGQAVEVYSTGRRELSCGRNLPGRRHSCRRKFRRS